MWLPKQHQQWPRTILASTQTLARGQPTRNAKASDPEPSDGSRESTEQFVQSVCIAVTMQLDAFTDEGMKILYTLSFMRGGMAQVWVANKTSAILDNMSSFGTLTELWHQLKGPSAIQTRKGCLYTATYTKDDTGYDGRGVHGQFRDAHCSDQFQ